MIDIPLSVLELAMTETGGDAAAAFAATTVMARRAEELGFRRAWIAEHHGSAAIASASPPVLTAHLAAATTRIRVGSGGVLAPNHAPLAVAEQFATLAALHPDRIDLGIGRGPGTFDQNIVRALRRGADAATPEDYRRDVGELLGHLSGASGLRLLPGTAPLPRPWLLASSTAGAELAAELGLPVAFAHHIRPGNTVEAAERYRSAFRPSRWSSAPYVIVAVETLCADTDSEAVRLARPGDVLKAYLLSGLGDTGLRTPEAAAEHEFTPEIAERIAEFRATQAQGSPGTVRQRLTELSTATGADELMLLTPIYDPSARVRSLELIVKTS
ncbi:LLM class flavin-dependent oxidoreductase [Nocardia sp. NPDC127526]|uniref:LLM class flavin-dependent oxidoreductase n=1 Tax=Nocardia sp. NPDC127526 TaxID=3345393 RepID=UPI003644A140